MGSFHTGGRAHIYCLQGKIQRALLPVSNDPIFLYFYFRCSILYGQTFSWAISSCRYLCSLSSSISDQWAH